MVEFQQEYDFTDADFRRVRGLIKARAGIEMGEHKRALIYGRLIRRIRQLKLSSFGEYLDIVEAPDGDEATAFINAITTNVTSFFRENHHFEFLAKTVLPGLYRKHAQSRRIRIWSAGCSTGEEPYSIAMTLRECPPPTGETWDIKILATDLDSDVLQVGKQGRYALDRMAGVDPGRIGRWFNPRNEGKSPSYEVARTLRDLITFKELNLMGAWPMSGPFDVIFCRNVVIYFDEATKMNLVSRYHDYLADGGYLFLGHSESVVGGIPGFASCGRTAYQRSADKKVAA